MSDFLKVSAKLSIRVSNVHSIQLLPSKEYVTDEEQITEWEMKRPFHFFEITDGRNRYHHRQTEPMLIVLKDIEHRVIALISELEYVESWAAVGGIDIGF